ncbi:hypothetical protein [Clostridium sp. Ade.TY]|uniref:hypothetical protein n=1 Tax=Clostridium sp. Ade.TY TaxID=1391647 RepID=UPI0004142509|nr:hypothetical protein [Clostridium sp. Ade.TY]
MTKDKLKGLINFETGRLDILKSCLKLNKDKTKEVDILNKINKTEEQLTKDILEYKRLCVQFQ